MSELSAYLIFNGNCAEAMRFYERTLGGKLERMMTARESPASDHVPAEALDQIMHARLSLDGGFLMASDAMGMPTGPMQGFSLSLMYPTVEEATRVFGALAEGGKVTMQPGKTFWSEYFGMVTDRFGTPWMVNGGEQATS
jgi:PhnB protein